MDEKGSGSVGLFASARFAGSEGRSLQVKSPSMNKSIEVVVVSPDMAATKACPVIYLLHGYGGNARTWVGIKPDLPKIADEKGIFFVCPDGKNTWYWDSPLNADVRYETFISDELVKYVDSIIRQWPIVRDVLLLV